MKKIMKSLLALAIIILVLVSSHFYREANHKAEVFMARLIDNYYDQEVVKRALKGKLGENYDENLYKNFDNYVIQLIMDDLNRYETADKSKYNKLFSKEELEDVLEEIDSSKREFESKSIDDNISYIYINDFVKNQTYNLFKKGLLDVNGKENLIIDLRDNSGGYISELALILDDLTMQGEVLFSLENSKKQRIFESKNALNKSASKLKHIVFIVNENTASTSELMIQSLKAFYKVDIVGERTRGKYFTFGIKKYFDKSGTIFVTNLMVGAGKNRIPTDGIEPDYYEDNEELQLEKAIELIKN